MTIERGEAFDDRIGDVSGAEDNDPPITVVIRFEEQLYRAATRHADVALKIPFNEFGKRRLVDRLPEHSPSALNRLMLDSAATHRSRNELAGGHQHLAACFLRRAALRLNHRHAYE